MNCTYAKVADRLLRVAQRDPARDTILRENVTTLLAQAPEDFVEGLHKLDDLNGTYAKMPVEMALKLSRDLRQKPFSDAQVWQHLENLEGQLAEKSKEIIAASEGFPCKFYVCGSLLKGRFGANSDVDVLCEASPQWMESQRFKYSQEPVSFQYMDMPEKDTFRAAFGPSVEIAPQERGVLSKLYVQTMEERGFEVMDGHLKATREQPGRPLEVPPEEAKRIGWGLPMV